jgi:Arc/MetJ family transcription regulator
MRTTIDIDDNLIREAMRLSGLPTKKATVEAALRLLVETYESLSVKHFRRKVRPTGDLDTDVSARSRSSC